MDRRRVGRSLHVLRRARSLRQADVAAAAGVSQPTVSAIERGRFGAMPLRTLERVFDAVEADIDLVVRHRGGEIDHSSTRDTRGSSCRSPGSSVQPAGRRFPR